FAASYLAIVVQTVDNLPRTTYDSIIFEGDTADAVLANRLTKISKFHVLLIEAGPSHFIFRITCLLLPSMSTHRNVGVLAYEVPDQLSLRFSLGHTLGGCSSHSMYYSFYIANDIFQDDGSSQLHV
ncbi:hypothetical protein CVT25_008587, partial [Psilocybe cyanescens]